MIYFLFFGNLFDLILTYIVVNGKFGYEMNIFYNTIFNKDLTSFLLFKFFGILFFIFLLEFLFKKHKDLLKLSYLLLGVSFWILGFMNLYILIK